MTTSTSIVTNPPRKPVAEAAIPARSPTALRDSIYVELAAKS